jgi:hypothetical protein
MNKETLVRSLRFEPLFAETLPEIHALLSASNLALHPAVTRVTLHGSRGLAGGYRSNSDLDLSLIIDAHGTQDLESQFQEILETTMKHWQSEIELDLAVIFDIRNCRLACFEQRNWDRRFCPQGGMDCFGLYKIQKGFNGLVIDAGIQVKLMYPCLKIWQQE